MSYFFQSLQPRFNSRWLQAQMFTTIENSGKLLILLFFIVSTTLFSDVYRIQEGDTLLIAVIGQPEYTHSVQVREDGMISYFGGDLEVAGQTAAEVTQRIREFLVNENLVSNPVIMVSPVLQEHGIFVGGAVKTPGRYPISPETDIGLYRAIALAGGMAENADRQGVQLIRTESTQKVETYNLSTNRPYRNIRVNVNDLVFVMPLSVVEVQGQVQVPGKLFIRGQMSIEQALARAGGLTQEADLSAVKVEKDGKLSEFNLSEQFWKSPANSSPLPTLSNGDVLFVPNVFKREPIYVTGYVRAPGAQRVRGPLTVGQAVALGGGFDASAEREEVLIHRRDGTSLKTPFMSGSVEGAAQHQVLLYPGDILEVKKKFQVNWGLVTTFAYITLSGITIILNLIQ